MCLTSHGRAGLQPPGSHECSPPCFGCRRPGWASIPLGEPFGARGLREPDGDWTETALHRPRVPEAPSGGKPCSAAPPPFGNAALAGSRPSAPRGQRNPRVCVPGSRRGATEDEITALTPTGQGSEPLPGRPTGREPPDYLNFPESRVEKCNALCTYRGNYQYLSMLLSRFFFVTSNIEIFLYVIYCIKGILKQLYCPFLPLF